MDKKEKELLPSSLLFVIVRAAVPPKRDNSPAPAAVIIVFKGNLSFRFKLLCEYAIPSVINNTEIHMAFKPAKDVRINATPFNIDTIIISCLFVAFPVTEGLFVLFILSTSKSVISL